MDNLFFFVPALTLAPYLSALPLSHHTRQYPFLFFFPLRPPILPRVTFTTHLSRCSPNANTNPFPLSTSGYSDPHTPYTLRHPIQPRVAFTPSPLILHPPLLLLPRVAPPAHSPLIPHRARPAHSSPRPSCYLGLLHCHAPPHPLTLHPAPTYYLELDQPHTLPSAPRRTSPHQYRHTTSGYFRHPRTSYYTQRPFLPRVGSVAPFSRPAVAPITPPIFKYVSKKIAKK